MTHFDISVVIGFRDWGAERLNLAVKSVQNSFGSLAGEVILVDYGSRDPSVASEIAGRFKLKLAKVFDVPVWSRSRALNAGFALAEGDLYISTDADMLFAPRTLETVHRWWSSSRDSALFLQCRDLPETIKVEDLSSQQIDWRHLESVSTLRPRWGVGGMMAISQQAFRQMRGLDERMTTYGREDMDFALRARRNGQRMVWVEDELARIYHMWHPPTSVVLEKDKAAIRSVDINRKIYAEDTTIIRNRSQWIHGEDSPLPVVSIVFSDGLLSNLELIKMLRLQTVSSFEIILPERFAGEVESMPDSRIRFSSGSDDHLATILDSCRGRYILPLSGIKAVGLNFLESLLDEMGGMTRLVVPEGLVSFSEVPNIELRACMFERNVFSEIIKGLVQERALTRGAFIEIAGKNGIEFRTVNGVNFLESNKSLVEQGGESAIGAVAASDEFWPFLVDSDAEIVVQVDGADIQLLEGAALDGDLTISTVSIDGRVLHGTSLLRNATVDDLLVVSSYGFKFNRVDTENIRLEDSAPGYSWAIEALRPMVEQLHWEPYAAILVDLSPDSACEPITPDMVYQSSLIRRKHKDSQEDLMVFLTRDKHESDLVYRNWRSSVKFVLCGNTQGAMG
ncbi:glycosyltransferase family 2 protein [Glutamicibacter arilaitensis]|uniref:glycosyltransferase family 2 protein n=1 Tax=Glutamicibacter arilaitensis TaxID=256701 RepID=UPI003FD5D413